jgi:hypothetical protein
LTADVQGRQIPVVAQSTNEDDAAMSVTLLTDDFDEITEDDVLTDWEVPAARGRDPGVRRDRRAGRGAARRRAGAAAQLSAIKAAAGFD